MSNHPIQPLEVIAGVLRFKPNSIVQFLLDQGPYDLNYIAAQDWPREDREQLSQLIGYSLSGFADLSHVSDQTYYAAVKMSEGHNSDLLSRIEVLEEQLKQVRHGLKQIVPVCFRISNEDLKDEDE
jgi:hypothetical protein